MLLSSHAKQPLLTCATGIERGGEVRKREKGLGREGKGLALPFPFALFSLLIIKRHLFTINEKILKIFWYDEFLWTNNPETDQVYVRDCLIDPRHLKLKIVKLTDK